MANSTSPATPPRHPYFVRITHWLTAICFLALLVSGVEMIIPHPRFYWGEAGNALTPALFQLPIPASRGAVKTGYNFVLKDQNGWSRSLHFQAAWFAVFTALLYGFHGLRSGHFRKNLLPSPADLKWSTFSNIIANHLRLKPPPASEASSYNVLQRLTYLLVIFVLAPLIVWTGLAMSPAFTAAVPASVTIFGGQQSARTIHFFVFLALLLFFLVHIAMVSLAGFKSRVRAITNITKEQP